MSATDAQFPQKLAVLFEHNKWRFKVLYGGRAAGRSWGCARALLLIGLERPIRVLCARELQNSVADSVHRLLADQVEMLGLGGFYKIEQQKIYGANGTTFSFEGIKNNTTKIKSYEGIDYCWVEEAARVSRNSWSILVPTIRKPGSEIWITFNPELETDYTYDRFVKSAGDDCAVVKMTYRDNPFVNQTILAQIEQDKKRNYDEYLNVWEGHPLQVLDGVVYAKELRRATEENRITAVPYDRTVPVGVWFDLGRADNTALWFAQRVAMQWRMLAYYEESGEDISHFVKYLQSRQYVYSNIYLPHDAAAKRLGMKLTIQEQIAGAGFPVSIVPKLSVEDGINAGRLVFGSCWFDREKCADGLNALRHYRYRVDEQGARSTKPLHDWASDGADAFRYFAISSGRQKPDRAGVLERLKQAQDSRLAERTRELEVGSGRGGRGAAGGWLDWMGR